MFFDYPELTTALDNDLNLVVLWLGENDITSTSRPKDIFTDLFKIKHEFESRGISIIMMTIENHDYRHGHPHYVAAAAYNSCKNSINRVLQRKCRGSVALTCGLSVNSSQNGFDRVHLDRQGRQNMQNKVLGAINNFLKYHRRQHGLREPFPVNY